MRVAQFRAAPSSCLSTATRPNAAGEANECANVLAATLAIYLPHAQLLHQNMAVGAYVVGLPSIGDACVHACMHKYYVCTHFNSLRCV